jgi:O-antigen/teichoic acid export membrane protein
VVFAAVSRPTLLCNRETLESVTVRSHGPSRDRRHAWRPRQLIATARLSGHPRSLRRNFSATLAGNVGYAFCQFATLAVLARLTSATTVGQYALALAITGPVFVFSNLKLRQIQVTDAAYENKPSEFFGLRAVSSCLGLVCVVLVAATGYDGVTARTIVAVAIFKLFESQIDILYGAMQRREQMQLIARGQLLRGVGGLGFFAVSLRITSRVDVATLCLALFTATQYGVNARQVRGMGVPTLPAFPWRRLLALAWTALPLGISVSMGSLLVNVPRYFIASNSVTADVGIYSVLAYPLIATSLITGALAQAATPRLANLHRDGASSAFRSTVRQLLRAGAALGLGTVVLSVAVGRPFLRIAFGEEYSAHYGVFLLLVLGAGVQYATAFLGTAVNAMRMFRIQLPITLCAIATVVIVCYFAVPAWGMAGAALSLLSAQLVQAGWYFSLIRRRVFPRLLRQP